MLLMSPQSKEGLELQRKRAINGENKHKRVLREEKGTAGGNTLMDKLSV